MKRFSVRQSVHLVAWLLLFTIPFLIFAASVWNAHATGESFAQEDAMQSANRARFEMLSRTAELFGPMKSMIRVAASLAESDPGFFRTAQGSNYMDSMLFNGKNVDRVYVAFADGSLRMSLKILPNARIGDRQPPQGAALAHRWLDRSDQSKPLDQYIFFDKQFQSLGESNALAEFDPREQSWFRQTVDSAEKITLSEPYVQASTGKVGITISMPIFFNGELIGMVAADVTLDSLSEFLALHPASKNSVSMILDQDQRIIAHPDPRQSVFQESGVIVRRNVKNLLSDLPAFAMAKRPRGAEVFTFQYGADKATYFAAVSSFPTDLGKGWDVLMVAPMADFSGKWNERNRQQVVYGFLFIFVELLLTICLLIWLVRTRRKKVQAQTLVTSLKSSERALEEQLSLFKAELDSSNVSLSECLVAVETSHQRTEIGRLQVTQAQEESISAQALLIQSEKMASLGQIIAGVAHEINTPVSAVKASGENIADALFQALTNMPRLFSTLDEPSRQVFQEMVLQALSRTTTPSSREERNLTRDAVAFLAANNVDDAPYKAGILVQINAHARLTEFLPLLRHTETDLILDTAHAIANIVRNARNINTAVARVTKIVLALKSFAHSRSEDWVAFDLRSSIDIVLTIFHSQIPEGVELVCNFEDIAPLRCLPDELSQVWTNLIHNALQAMVSGGTLTIDLRRVENQAVVSITDTGSGIPEEIRSKIFDVFFTTKPVGVGTGLGLDIVKKIIDKHKGRIDVHSEVGVGTSFTIYLPYNSEEA